LLYDPALDGGFPRCGNTQPAPRPHSVTSRRISFWLPGDRETASEQGRACVPPSGAGLARYCFHHLCAQGVPIPETGAAGRSQAMRGPSSPPPRRTCSLPPTEPLDSTVGPRTGGRSTRPARRRADGIRTLADGPFGGRRYPAVHTNGADDRTQAGDVQPSSLSGRFVLTPLPKLIQESLDGRRRAAFVVVVDVDDGENAVLRIGPGDHGPVERCPGWPADSPPGTGRPAA